MNRAVPAGNEAWQTTVALWPASVDRLRATAGDRAQPVEEHNRARGRALADPDETVAIRVARCPATSGAGDITNETALVALTTALRGDAAGLPAPPPLIAVSNTATVWPTSAAVSV